jgi:chromosome partitioning protein
MNNKDIKIDCNQATLISISQGIKIFRYHARNPYREERVKTIGVFNSKGGSGKSTIAVHVGVAAAYESRVALLDADPQGTLSTWGTVRQEKAPAVMAVTADSLQAELRKLELQGVELALVDCPPYITAESSRLVNLCDFIVVPVQPTMPDISGCMKAIKIILAAKKPFAFVVNRVRPRAPETQEAVDALKQHGDVCKIMFGDRVAFSRALASGLSVHEFSAKSEAGKEAAAVSHWILSMAKEK